MFILCKILLCLLCLLILSPQGTVDGLQVQISQEIHPLFRGVATPGEDRPELQIRPLGLHFFVPALLLSMLTHLFLSSSLSLSYFILAIPMRKCLGKHWCMSSSFPIAILNGTCFFRQCNYKCTLCISAHCVFGA